MNREREIELWRQVIKSNDENSGEAQELRDIIVKFHPKFDSERWDANLVSENDPLMMEIMIWGQNQIGDKLDLFLRMDTINDFIYTCIINEKYE